MKLFRKKQAKPTPPFGPVTVAVNGRALVASDVIQVTDTIERTFATVTANPYFDKVLTLQTAATDPLGTEFQTLQIGLMADEAKILGAALLGITEPNVGPITKTGENPEAALLAKVAGYRTTEEIDAEIEDDDTKLDLYEDDMATIRDTLDAIILQARAIVPKG